MNAILIVTRKLTPQTSHRVFLGFLIGLSAIVVASAQTNHSETVLRLNAAQAGPNVSPLLYGLMTEEINYSYDGGLYAELIRNRTFKYHPQEPRFWRVFHTGSAGGSISLDASQPLNNALNVSLRLDITNASDPVGVANEGFWGIPVNPYTTYRASFYAMAARGATGPLTVSIMGTNGSTVLASAQTRRISTKWEKYEVNLTAGKVQPSRDNLFVISAGKEGTIWFSQVSLFPPTWNDRQNGNRIDIMQLLADMRPAFLRFPGGNYLEGNFFTNRFDWKKTIGDTSERPGHLNDGWRYWSTDGIGLLEFLEWCEDLRMQPVLGVYAAYSMRQGGMTNELDACVQDALDEIEYVTGDTNSTWGGRRAKDGHPAPFKLDYVEIGNEDNLGTGARTYDLRFTKFYDAIKAKYPNIKVISTCPSDTSILTNRTPDVIDDHYYRTPEQMQDLATRYDNYDRSRPKIFVGEYASQSPGTNRQVTPNMADALGDAAFLTGLERNSDVVIMSAYAPLFVNVNPGGRQWSTDLIGYDAMSSFGSPSYYVQKMFNLNRGDVVVPVSAENVPMREWQPPRGRGAQAPEPRPLATLFFSATRDRMTGTIYLKVVNPSGSARSVRIETTGLSRIESAGELVELKARSPLDTNSISDPLRLVPATSPVKGLSANFTRTFPPYSVSILQMRGR